MSYDFLRKIYKEFQALNIGDKKEVVDVLSKMIETEKVAAGRSKRVSL